MRFRHTSLAVAAVLCLALLWPDSARARELHWDLLEVSARLDAAGDLHVVERQVMVLDGAWNGGERTFRVGPGQRLVFQRLSRVDEQGGVHPLAPGRMDRVDQYSWADARTLRWRSRLPTDPPFHSRALTYVLEYTLGHVLMPRAGPGAYQLAHDFAFPSRAGDIRLVRARLELDSAWETGAARTLELRDLPPGKGAVLVVPLRWVGQGKAPSVTRYNTPAPQLEAATRPSPPAASPFSPGERLALRVALGAALLAAFGVVVLHGRARGLFRLPDPATTVTEAWLREHVLSQPAEVIGGAWDGGLGGAEVSAVLARLTLQGKLETRFERKWLGLSRSLHLRLLVDRTTLEGDERRLVAGLFPAGSNTSSTEWLRRRYQRTGFAPVERLKDASQALERLWRTERRAWWPTFAAVLALVVAAGWLACQAVQAGEPGPPLVLLLYAIPLNVLGLMAAAGVGSNLRFLRIFGLAAALPYLAWAVAIDQLAGGAMDAGRITVLTQLAAWGATLTLAAGLARTRLSPETLALRSRLQTARRWFARELASPTPRLRDEWLPYLVALELGGRVDRWLRVHGAGVSSGGGLGGGSSAGSRWSGGGGSFSGGGASGSWAALGGLASVAAPSRSGGSGGSGGGSSSGGGGGGGW